MSEEGSGRMNERVKLTSKVDEWRRVLLDWTLCPQPEQAHWAESPSAVRCPPSLAHYPGEAEPVRQRRLSLRSCPVCSQQRAVHVSLHRHLHRVSCVSESWLEAGLWGDQNKVPPQGPYIPVGETPLHKEHGNFI